jgi:uncharacterized membrane protein YeaQ/YmgE (transglycosylase-associated protein family)
VGVPVRLEAVVGDTIFTELGLVGVTGVNLTSILVAAIGAIVVLSFITQFEAEASARVT